MRTRKRCYDLEEESKRKRCYDLTLACSSKLYHASELTNKELEEFITEGNISPVKFDEIKGLCGNFMSLLAKACDGTDNSMGLPSDEGFWTIFAEKLRSQMNIQEKESTAKSCEAYGKRLQSFYYALQGHRVVPLKNMKAFLSLCQSPDFQNYNLLLEKIFGRHPELFTSWETSKTVGVPETSSNGSVPVTSRSSGSSLNRANKNVVSSKVSSLRPELEMGLRKAFDDLVSHNMLDLRDVADAESYLSTSTWASSIFLQQEDQEKRSAMIINARKNA